MNPTTPLPAIWGYTSCLPDVIHMIAISLGIKQFSFLGLLTQNWILNPYPAAQHPGGLNRSCPRTLEINHSGGFEGVFRG